MALNKVAKYIRNIGKSVVYAADDTVLRNIAPTIISYRDSNAEVAKTVAHAARDFSGTVRRTTEYMKSTRIYEAGSIFKSSLLEDLSNGTFYNKERGEKYAGKALGISMDFDDNFDFDTDLDNDTDNFDISDGDKATIESIESTSRASTLSITNAVVNSSKYQAEVSKANTAILFTQQERLFGRLNAGVSAVNEGINSLIKFNTGVISTHIENSTKFFDVMTKNTQEQTAILKEMLEMQRNQYAEMAKAREARERRQKNRKSNYNDLVTAEGAVNLADYLGLLKRNTKDVLDEYGLGQLGFFSDDPNQNALAAFAANPLGWIPEAIVQAAIGPKLRKELKNFDNVMSGVFGTVMARLSKMSRSNNEVEALIGKLFGARDDLKKNINTSKYVKGPIPFDGETKKAITDVIPTLLANIESAITGTAAKQFDYSTGKYTTRIKVKDQYNRMRRSNIQGAFSDVMNEFANMIQRGPNGKPLSFRSKADEKEFYDDMQRFFTEIYNQGGYFNVKKPGSASDYAINEENFNRIIEMYRRLPKRVQLQLGGNVQQARNSFSRMMEEYEAKGNSVFNILSNGIDPKEYIKVNSRKEVSRNNAFLPKDDLGHDSFYYLNRLLKESIISNEYLYGIFARGGMGSGRRNKRYRKIDKIEEDKINIDRSSSITNKIESRLRDEQRDIENRAKEATAGKTTLVEEGSDQFARAADSYAKYKEEADLDSEINDQSWLAKAMRDAIGADKNIKGKKEEDPRKKLRDKVDLGVRDFAGRFTAANTITEKWRVITDQIGVLVSKPTTWLADKLNAASENIYNFLFEDEMEGGPGQRVKGFFEAMRVKMMNAFDRMVNGINKHIIDPIMKRIDPEGKASNIASRLGLTQLKDRFWGRTKQRTKEMAGSLWSGYTDQMGKAADALGFTAEEISEATSAMSDSKYAGKTMSEVLRMKRAEKEKAKAQNGEVTQNASGTRMVNKTGLSVLSEGEMVIPSELNPFYNKAGQVSKKTEIGREKAVSQQFANKLSKFILNNISSNAEGNLGDGTKISIDPRAKKVYKTVGNSINTLVLNHGNDNVKKVYQEMSKNLDVFVPEGLAGGAVGGVLGLVTGLGPFAGLVIGSGIAIARKSDTIQNILFGELDDEGNRKGGLISKDVQDTVTKALPDLKLFGAVGGTAGLLGLTPFGILGGLAIGGSIAMLKNNQSFMNNMFGEEGLIDKNKQEFLKKAFPKMALGTVATYALGPFGLVGSALLGSGLGMISSTEKFQSMLLGDKMFNGKRTGGLVGIIKTNFANPLINFGKELTSGMLEFMERDIYDPLRKGVGPLLRYTGVMIGNIGAGIGSVLSKVFGKSGVQASKYLNYYLGRPVRGILDATVGNAIRGGVWAGKKVISAPFKAVGALGNAAQRRLIASGNANNMTADERLAWRYSHGVNYDAMMTNDITMSNLNTEQLKQAYNAAMLLGGEKEYNKSIDKDTNDLANNISGFLPEDKAPGMTKNIMSLITSEDPDKVRRGIRLLEQHGQFATGTERSRFLAHVNDVASNIRENKGRKANFSANRAQAVDKLKSIGINVNKGNYQQVLANLRNEYKTKTKFEKSTETPEEQLVNATKDGTERVVSVLSDIVTLLSGQQLSPEQRKKYQDLRIMGALKTPEGIKEEMSARNTVKARLGGYYSDKEINKSFKLFTRNGKMTDKYILFSKLMDAGIKLGSPNDIKDLSELDVENLIKLKKAANKGHVPFPNDYKSIKGADLATVETMIKGLEKGAKISSIRDALRNPDQLELAMMKAHYDIPENMSLDRAKALALTGGLSTKGKHTKASEQEYTDADGKSKRVEFTEYGPITYVKSRDGSWDPANDPETKNTLAERERKTKAIEENNKNLSGIGAFFAKFTKKKTDPKEKQEESFLSKIFGGIMGGLKAGGGAALGALGVVFRYLFKGLFGAGKILAVGKLVELVRPHISSIVETIVKGIAQTIPVIFNMAVGAIKELPSLATDIAKGLYSGVKESLFGTKGMTPEEAKAKGWVEVTHGVTGEKGYADPEGNFHPLNDDGLIGSAKGLLSTDPASVAVMGGLATYKLGKFGYDTIKGGKDWVKSSANPIAKFLRKRFGIKQDLQGIDIQADATITSAERIVSTSVENTDRMIDAIYRANGMGSPNVPDRTNPKGTKGTGKSNPKQTGGKSTTNTTKSKSRLGRMGDMFKNGARRIGTGLRGIGGGLLRSGGAGMALANSTVAMNMVNTGARSTVQMVELGNTAAKAAESASKSGAGNIGSSFKSAVDQLLTKLPDSGKLKKVASRLVPKLVPRLGALLGTAALTGGLSLIGNVAFAAASFATGTVSTDTILGIENPTMFERIVSGFCNALSGLVFGIIPAEFIGSLYMESPLSKDEQKTESRESQGGEDSDPSLADRAKNFLSSINPITAVKSVASAVYDWAFGDDDKGGKGGKGKYGRGFFKQNDPRYANMRFNAAGDSIYQNMYDSGCGPIAAVNALYGRGTPNPVEAANFALKGGYKEKDGGTMPGFFGSYFNAHGARAAYTSGQGIMNNLRAGNPVVLMGQSNKIDTDTPYGTGPHYVTATGIDGRGNMIIQDPQDSRNNIKYKASKVIAKTKFGVAAMKNTIGNTKFNLKHGIGMDGYGKFFTIRTTRYGRGSDIPQTIWDFLTAKGLKSQTVAAIMGNIFQESGYDPEAVNPSSGAYGICQWLGSRKDALANVAAQMGKPMSDINVQLTHLWNELTGSESESLRLTDSAADLDTATRVFCEEFERCGKEEAMNENRINAAREAFQKQGKGISTSGSYKPGGAAGSSGSAQQFSSGFMGVLERKAAPLQNLYNQIFGVSGSSSGSPAGNMSGPGGSLSNPVAANNPVDYLLKNIPGSVLSSDYGNRESPGGVGSTNHGGVDIAADQGSPVPTPVDGEVYEVSSQPSGYGNYVQLKDGKGNYHMFAHLDSQSVTAGQRIKAGTIIGNMGSTGASTGPHTHYAINPPENVGAVTGGASFDPHGYDISALGGGIKETGGNSNYKFNTGNVQQSITGAPISADQQLANAIGGGAFGKYGRGKFGTGGSFKRPVPVYGTGLVDTLNDVSDAVKIGKNIKDQITGFNNGAPTNDKYMEIFKQMLQALLVIAQNTGGGAATGAANANVKDGNATNTQNAQNTKTQNQIDRLKEGLKNMGSANGVGQISPHSDIGSIMSALRNIAAI